MGTCPAPEQAADNAPGKSSSKRKREREGKEAEEPQNPECTCFVGGIPYAVSGRSLSFSALLRVWRT